MNSMYSVTEAQARLPKLIKEAQDDHAIAITRHDKTVAFLISRDRMEGIMETLEIMADEEAMKAIRKYREGKMKFHSLGSLDEN